MQILDKGHNHLVTRAASSILQRLTISTFCRKGSTTDSHCHHTYKRDRSFFIPSANYAIGGYLYDTVAEFCIQKKPYRDISKLRPGRAFGIKLQNPQLLFLNLQRDVSIQGPQLQAHNLAFAYCGCMTHPGLRLSTCLTFCGSKIIRQGATTTTVEHLTLFDMFQRAVHQGRRRLPSRVPFAAYRNFALTTMTSLSCSTDDVGYWKFVHDNRALLHQDAI